MKNFILAIGLVLVASQLAAPCQRADEAGETKTIQGLIQAHKFAEAEKLLHAELVAAIKEFQAAPDDASRAVRLAGLMQLKIKIAAQAAPLRSVRCARRLLALLPARSRSTRPACLWSRLTTRPSSSRYAK